MTVRLTQSQFEPIRIGERIWVVPSWHDAPEPDAVVLELDPGLAFGTGSHPTTRLCMQWLEQNLRPGETVLDYGCGSGILAIVAKSWAQVTLGIDIDPNAVEASRYNAERNRVEATFALPETVSEATHDPYGGQYPFQPAQLMAAMLSARVPWRPRWRCGRARTAGRRGRGSLCALDRAGASGAARKAGSVCTVPAPDIPTMAAVKLVTRCPACRTAFRLVADQLRLRQDWCAAAAAIRSSMPAST